MLEDFRDRSFDADDNGASQAATIGFLAAALGLACFLGVAMVLIARDWSWYFVAFLVAAMTIYVMRNLRRSRQPRVPELLQTAHQTGTTALAHGPVSEVLVGGTVPENKDNNPETQQEPNDGKFYVVASTKKYWVKLVWPVGLVAISVLTTVLIAWLESINNVASLPIRLVLLAVLVVFALVIPYLISRYSARRWIDAWKEKKWVIIFRLIGTTLLIGAVIAVLTLVLDVNLGWVLDVLHWTVIHAVDVFIFISQSTTITAALFIGVSVLTLAYQMIDYKINRICRESNGNPSEDRVVVEKGIILQSRPSTPLSAIVDNVPEVFISLFNKGVRWCTIKVGTAEEEQAIDKIRWLPRSFLAELGIPDPVTAKYAKVRRVRVSRRKGSA